MENNPNNSKGVDIFDLLLVLFVGLKLTSQIDWAWWLVLSPIWLPWLVAALLLSIVSILKSLNKRNEDDE